MNSALGEAIEERFTHDSARQIQEEIARAGGHEVFFAGELGEEGRVCAVRVLARGHGEAVPAVFEGLAIRSVVIHNHPSGDLSPSDADLELASMYGNHGHGVYIVDNDVLRVYVVVEPFLPDERHALDTGELGAVFSPNSPLARTLPHFEVRPQQVEMMEVISRAFNRDGVAVVEAPTGVGKTVAYLLPAIRWALDNKERVVISTRTINLQEQIVRKDVPLLRRALDEEFSACLVKGRGNYVCLRKLQRSLSEATLFDDKAIEEQFNALAGWVEKTADGSRSDLPFVPNRDLWERVCSESDTCAMGRCPNQARCFVTRARREVAKADIIVANHHMLFSDVAIKAESGDFSAFSVLPSYKRVIFDEAHSIEDSATEYFGVSATRLGALATLARFQRSERSRDRGLIPLLRAKLVKDCPQLSVPDFETIQTGLEEHLLPALAACRSEIEAAFDALRSLASAKSGQIGRDVHWRLSEDVLMDPAVRDVHAIHVMPAVESLRAAVRHCKKLQDQLEDISPMPHQEESPVATERLLLRAYTQRLVRVGHVLAEITSEELQENTVRWIEISARKTQFVRLARAPLEVGKPLAEWVYGNLSTVAMTSATLTVDQRFDYFFRRLGLDQVDGARIESASLDSPFDFSTQAMLAIPSDLPEPNAADFLEESIETIRHALRISRGHAFVLFTSFRALDSAYRELESELREAGITPLKQGLATRTQLLDEFRRDTASVLFATDSFWEGVDVAGEALQCVILPKLPFRVPTEPIQQARSEAIDQAGGNAFMAYSVPQAVIKFRQGFGRLIRRRSDRGVILVLDRRVVTKHYGRVFLRSLPDARVVKGPRNGVFTALSRFFNRNGNHGDDSNGHE